MELLVRRPSPPLLLFHSHLAGVKSYRYGEPPWRLPRHTQSSSSLSCRLRYSRSDSVPIAGLDTFSKKSGYLFELCELESESESMMIEYDIAKITDLCRPRPLILIRRIFQIATTFGRWFTLRYVDGLLGRADTMFKVRAAELRKILVELGPAYVKIAQAVSSRPDLIPPSYLEELSLLQDQISPFSNQVAFDTIEQELGLSINKLFSEITPEPIAAASLGQVYQAKLRQTGQIVAVKVQRPGVLAAISLDTLILRSVAGLVRRVRKLNTDLQAVVDEWASSLFREMDYMKEAQNCIRFRELYGSLQDVFVPRMYIDSSTSKVLLMEWVEGQKLSEVNDVHLVNVGVYCSLNQLLEYGFYHADPHPGNLLRTYDGKLAYLDFGMMGEFEQELRYGFIVACLHLVNRDFDALAKDFITLGLLPPTAEKEAVAKALAGVFENAVSKGVRNISFGDLLGNLGLTMYKFKFRIPSYFTLVIRSLAVLEGIAISSQPDYKVLGSTYPWIAQKVLTDSSPTLKSSLQALLYEDGVFRIDRLESLLRESLRARTDQVDITVVDSRLVTNKILYFTLSEKGTFVRDILVRETVKGLDALGLAAYYSLTSAASGNMPFPASISVTSMTEEDMTNLRNLHQLVLLISGLQNIERPRRGVEDANLLKTRASYMEEIRKILYQLTSYQELLPILSVLNGLPREMQMQFFSLPADVGARLISRMAARTIRRYLS